MKRMLRMWHELRYVGLAVYCVRMVAIDRRSLVCVCVEVAKLLAVDNQGRGVEYNKCHVPA